MKRCAHPVTAALLAWYRRARRDLPWRRDPDPYRVWLSEVMLQQTRVETVVPYYLRFLERFPGVADLASAREEEVLALWSGLGYYRRARSLLEGARRVCSRFQGEFPRRLSDALEIPGVGPYTAAAVLSIAYDLPHPVVDGNVERVVTRLLRLPGDPKRSRTASAVRAAVGGWIPADAPGDFNQALMELGATVCTPRTPSCSACPLRRRCEAHGAGDAERFPELPPPRASESVDLEVGILSRRRRYLLERPDAFPFLDGLWVFPLAECGSADPRSSSRADRNGAKRAGIASRLSRELGAAVRVTEDLPPIRHGITYRRITLHPKTIALEEPPVDIGPMFRWTRLEEMGETVPVSSIAFKVARLIDKRRRSRR